MLGPIYLCMQSFEVGSSVSGLNDQLADGLTGKTRVEAGLSDCARRQTDPCKSRRGLEQLGQCKRDVMLEMGLAKPKWHRHYQRTTPSSIKLEVLDCGVQEANNRKDHDIWRSEVWCLIDLLMLRSQDLGR